MLGTRGNSLGLIGRHLGPERELGEEGEGEDGRGAGECADDAEPLDLKKCCDDDEVEWDAEEIHDGALVRIRHVSDEGATRCIRGRGGLVS